MKEIPSSITSRRHFFEHKEGYKILFPKLSITEMAAIHAYSEKQYDNLNRFLRGEDFGAAHNAALETIAEILDGALTKCPPYTGTVYRGVDLPAAIKEAHFKAFNDKKPIEFNFFLSSSKTYGKAFEGKDTFYTIQSKTGVHIELLTVFMSLEDEVLFNRNSLFDITHMYEEDGVTLIEMTEV